MNGFFIEGTPFANFRGRELRQLKLLYYNFLESEYEDIKEDVKELINFISDAQVEGREEDEEDALEQLYSFLIFLKTYYMNHSEWAKIENLLQYVTNQLERKTKIYEMMVKYNVE